jgi:topoisomerase-4 subunit A
LMVSENEEEMQEAVAATADEEQVLAEEPEIIVKEVALADVEPEEVVAVPAVSEEERIGVKEDEPVQPEPAVVEKPAPAPEVKPAKKIDFEITNPEDLDIDAKGQIGLF